MTLITKHVLQSIVCIISLLYYVWDFVCRLLLDVFKLVYLKGDWLIKSLDNSTFVYTFHEDVINILAINRGLLIT